MKFLVDDVEVFSLTETQKKIIANDINVDKVDDDIKGRVKYIVKHKCDQCFARLKKEWEPKLKESGVKSIPLDEDEFAQLVFQQSDYQDRKKREEERLKNV